MTVYSRRHVPGVLLDELEVDRLLDLRASVDAAVHRLGLHRHPVRQAVRQRHRRAEALQESITAGSQQGVTGT